jgi:hypothetical protein
MNEKKTDIVKEGKDLVVKSPDFVYKREDGTHGTYEVILAAAPGGLAQPMQHFYQIEKHDTLDGVAYIGRAWQNGMRAAVLLNEHGMPISPVFDDIDGDLHLGAKMVTRTHEIAYSLLPDGTVRGISYMFPLKEELDALGGPKRIEGVGLTPDKLSWAMDEARIENSRRFPLDDFFEHKRGGENEEGK